MHNFPRPSTPTVHSPRETRAGACPEYGVEALSAYHVMSEGGWWNVVKCQVPAQPELAVPEGARRCGADQGAIFNIPAPQRLNAVLTRNIPKMGLSPPATLVVASSPATRFDDLI